MTLLLPVAQARSPGVVSFFRPSHATFTVLVRIPLAPDPAPSATSLLPWVV